MTENAQSAQLIKELRERTGVGMAKCKEALAEASGNMDQAIEILRKAGMASAVKKQGREAKEGVILFKETPKGIAIVEINAETDFVAKNDKFREFCHKIIDEVAATQPSTVEAFLQQKYSQDPKATIDELRSLIIQVIGENIVIRRVVFLAKSPDRSIGIYSHMGGKILTAVELVGSGEEGLARDIAMHAAAAAPEFLHPENVPQEIVTKEREIAREQIQGKPAHIIDKILDGKVNAFYDMHCLSRQKYIKDDALTISELIKKRGTQVNKSLALHHFLRWCVGQN